MSALRITCSNHVRPLVTFFDVPQDVRPLFTYMTLEETTEDRLFQYRASWYDVREFEVAGADLKRHGFDGVQAQSAWDAIAVKFFDNEGNELWHDKSDGRGIIVGHVTW